PILLAALALALGAASPIPPAPPRQAPADTSLVYLPVVSTFQPLAINIIANPSFEDQNWYTDYPHGGNQWPTGWTYFSTEKNDLMPFPTKSQGGSTVEARSGGWGEYVHKYQWQLPTEEYLGAPRGLILDGQLTYKAFADQIPFALAYSQVLHYTPGRTVNISGYILGETSIPRCSASGILEPDHFLASLQLGSNADTRLYVQMKDHFDVPGNERPWNKFQVTAQFPPSGDLLMKFIVQSNWGCEVNFFIDHFEAHDQTP
ncbi:MAG: hypothetical protein ABI847_01480, partial [Anaerolineales bacterium]